jgi:3-oxoacyl-[acyl-carrier protein] reductase
VSQLAGKVALVTGGTRGIGLSCVEAFASAGARVLWTGRSRESIALALARSPALDSADAIAVDFCRRDSATELLAAAEAMAGRLDILISNAGIMGKEIDPFSVTEEEWDSVIDVNLRSAFFVSKHAAALMRRTGGGSIVFIGSIAGQTGGAATGPAYVASKAGLQGLTKSLARHLAPHNIRANCIAPSAIATDMMKAWSETAKARVLAMTPLAHLGRPCDVAKMALFLGGEDASFVTGQTFNVNGGAYMS